MDVSIRASGQPSKFDIFDSGLTLLALHSACLALAFTASESEAISNTFNLILMIAGFASGAVLAVLAAYYGTINAKALGPQLMGGPIESSEAAPEILIQPASEQTDVVASNATVSSDHGDLRFGPATNAGTIPSSSTGAGRSAGTVAGVVLALLVVIATLLLQGAGANVAGADDILRDSNSRKQSADAALKQLVDSRHDRSEEASNRMARTGEPMNSATRASLEKTSAEVAAEREFAQATLAAAQAEHDADESSDRKRYWQAWLIIALTALVLAPIPLAWTAPNPVVSTVRGLLVLGSLLAFVLGVGAALLPLAAQAVGKGVEQATETRAELPGVADPREATPASIHVTPVTSGPITVVQPGPTPPGPGEAGAPGGSSPHPDIEGLRTDMAQLRTDMAAALARPVQVRMDPPEIRYMGPESTVQSLPPIQLTVLGHEGVPGAPGAAGAPAPVRECGWSWTNFKENLWPRSCEWVTPPSVLPASAPATPF